MNFKVLLTNLTLAGIFIFVIMAFIIQTQIDNEVDGEDRITGNYYINKTYSDLEGKFESYKSKVEASSGNFSVIPPTQQYGELEVTSIFSLTSTAETIMKGFWSALVYLPLNILGIDSSIINMIGALLLIFIIIGIWAIWKGAIA